MDIFSYVAGIAVLLFGIIAYMAWRQVRSLQQVLATSRDAFEAGKIERQRMQHELQRSLQRYNEKMSETNELHRRLKEIELQKAHLQAELSEGQRDKDELRNAHFRQMEILREQNQALTSQMSEMDKELAGLRAESQRVDQRKDLAVEWESKRQQLTNDLTRVQGLLNNALDGQAKAEQRAAKFVRKLEEAEARLEHFKPEDLVIANRRLSQAQQLYATMRGLKEMAEERAQNWELAMERMLVFIAEVKKLKIDPNVSFGEKVGRILEALAANFHDHELLGQPQYMDAQKSASRSPSRPGVSVTDRIEVPKVVDSENHMAKNAE